tara:strand:- start:257619 stop:257846 length:228 start_codon:yes stop_codon:yes gene_type:complete
MMSAKSSESPPIEDSRIHELEVRLAYQDHLLAELDGVVRSFALRVERLEHEIAELKESTGASLEVGSGNEPPPHY